MYAIWDQFDVYLTKKGRGAHHDTSASTHSDTLIVSLTHNAVKAE
jgi:hypothetical protein